MKRRAGVAILAVGVFMAAEAGSAADRAVARGGARSGGGGRSGWQGGGGGGGGRSARGPVTGAQARHPRAGTGSAYRGSYYGHGGGYGHKGYYGGKGYYGHGKGYYGYGRGYYPYRPYYGYGAYWPYYGGYPYYGYGWGPSLSIGFNYVADSGYAGYGGGYGGGYSGGPSGGYAEEREPYARDERTRDDVETGDVVLDVQPGDASVYVDDQFRGIGRDVRHLRLRAGRHRIEVVRPGYGTHYDEIVVEAGRDITVDVRLDRR